jgi:16S rRNA (adenine1518-N6/adenine1519-N6)-dimethyltransferase
VGARLGQHFLKDETVRDAAVAAARLSPGDKVLEIGPGRGFLTKGLLAEKVELTAVELDERLAQGLAGLPLRLIREDFLKLDLATLGPGPFVVVSNLPYSVGTPILQKILSWDGWTSAVLMFQKEVADRVVAGPGGADYGLLALSVINRAKAERVIEAPRQCFTPPPQVSSEVVRLVRRESPAVAPERERAFFRVAKAAFAQRRKMAAGTLSKSLALPRERVDAAFAKLGLDVRARPEILPFEAWRRLAEELAP